jgi:spore germination protein GerM
MTHAPWRGAAAAGLALLAAAATASCGGTPTTPAPARQDPSSLASVSTPPGDETARENTEDVVLYFVDENGDLAAEARSLRPQETPALQARALIEALVAGPRTGLEPLVPPDTAVRALHVRPDGTAYVDLNGAFAAGVSGGSEDALLAVRSIVETLTTNVPAIERVKILIEGDEPRALGGHLDLSHPLVPEGPRK